MHHDVTKVINSKEQVPRGRKVKRCGNVTDGSKCRIGKRKRLDQSVQPRGLGASKNQDEFPGKRHIRNTTSSRAKTRVRIPAFFDDPSAMYLVSTTGRTAPLQRFRVDPGERLRLADLGAFAAALLLI